MNELDTSRNDPIPLLSVVIPCFNAMPFIQDALDVVTQWPVSEVEIVVQDGGSTDGTLDVIRHYGDRISLISEKDSGQTDALNKAIVRSRGKFVAWLNADDLFVPSMFEIVRHQVSLDAGPDAIYGDYSIIRDDGTLMRKILLRQLDWSNLLEGTVPVWSGAVVWNRAVFERYGYFDESLHFCMDLEFFLRVSGSIHAHYVPFELGQFRFRRESKTGSQILGFIREGHRVRWHYSGASWRLRMLTLAHDFHRLTYLLTRRVWMSKVWSRIRPTHQF